MRGIDRVLGGVLLAGAVGGLGVVTHRVAGTQTAFDQVQLPATPAQHQTIPSAIGHLTLPARIPVTKPSVAPAPHRLVARQAPPAPAPTRAAPTPTPAPPHAPPVQPEPARPAPAEPAPVPSAPAPVAATMAIAPPAHTAPAQTAPVPDGDPDGAAQGGHGKAKGHAKAHGHAGTPPGQDKATAPAAAVVEQTTAVVPDAPPAATVPAPPADAPDVDDGSHGKGNALGHDKKHAGG